MNRYISRCLSRGHSKESIKNRLLEYGFEDRYIEKEIRDIHNRRFASYIILGILLTAIFIFIKPNITGNVIAAADDSKGTRYASIDYDWVDDTIVYQGEQSGLSVSNFHSQGKESGSLDVIDSNNDGFSEIFTTGSYKDSDDNQIASSELYDPHNSNTIRQFTNLADSDSCWADFNNDGYIEPVLVGTTGDENNQKTILEKYTYKDGKYEKQQLSTGMTKSRVRCADLNNDGWADIIESSQEHINIYKNEFGSLGEPEPTYQSVDNPSITLNDFNGDGLFDLILAGGSERSGRTYYYENSEDLTFSEPKLINDLKLQYSELLTADIDADDDPDMILLGDIPFSQIAKVYINWNATFKESINSIGACSEAKATIYNKQDKLYLHILCARANQDYPFDAVIQKPNTPQNLTYSKINGFVNLSWKKVPGKNIFYNVRAYKTSDNKNELISGVRYDAKGNAQLTDFKLLKDPCRTYPELPYFYFEVQSINGQYLASEWSAPKLVACKENITEKNQSNNINESIKKEVELLAPIENITQEPKTWTHTLHFQKLIYKAVYNREEDSVSVHEIITNEDDVDYQNVKIWHDKRFDIEDYGKYSDNLEYIIPYLKPGESFSLKLKVSKDAKYDEVLPTGLDAKKQDKSPVLKTELNESVKTEGNRTIITVPVKLNDSVISAEQIYIKQTIPKCLLEKINDVVAKSNRQYVIVNEDPVISWYLDDIKDEKELQLEIDNVAEENCTNQIVTEIVAKRFVIQKDRVNWLNAFVILVSAVLITMGVYYFIANAKEYHRKIAILISLALIFCLEIFDALSMLPASIDFLKKILSWLAMIALVYHVSLYQTLFAGKDRKKIIINLSLIMAFILLSIKNICYIAFLTYGKERWFSDLLLPVILYQNQLQTYLFFAGILLLLAVTIYLTFFSELSSPSFASLIHKTEYHFLHSRWKKPIYILIILLGFYIAFFNFFFDWFSISFDAPLLLLLLLIILLSLIRKQDAKLSDVPDASDNALQKFIKLFTHEKNLFVAFSAFPIFIFIVEVYNYLAYILLGIKSIYFDAIQFEMPTFLTLMPEAKLLPLYLIQLAGLVSAVLLAFYFWWHFFHKKEKSELLIHDNPHHPFLFSVFVTATLAYILKPVLSFSISHAKYISGLIISLKTVDAEGLTFIYFGLSVFFVISYLVFRDIRKANILPYLCLLTSVSWISLLFLYSFVLNLDFTPLFGNFSIYWINSLFMLFLSIIYSAIMLFSIYSLIGEFLALEHFKETKFYNQIMLAVFPHKITIHEAEAKLLKEYMEKMLEKGYEDYLIIEQIHESRRIPMKEIALMLKEIEEDDERKERYHHINHYHHNIEFIKKLHQEIKESYYRKGIGAQEIIDACMIKGWTQDDIAAAMMHIRYKEKDKILFDAMKRVVD